MTTKKSTLLETMQRVYASDDHSAKLGVGSGYEDAQLNIHIKPPLSNLRYGQLCKGTLISTKRSFQIPPVTCFVAYGQGGKIPINAPENSLGVNIISRLHEFVAPKGYQLFGKKDVIGLVTYQNGIANQSNDFKMMGEAILSKLRTSTLCIGLYNPTIDQTTDVVTIGDEILDPGDTSVICATRQMFITIANQLRVINPDLRWLHIAHSKGCFIANVALAGIKDKKLRDYLREKLVIDTYGGVFPIPKSLVYQSRNTYSVADKATWERFGKPCMDLDDYVIKPVESLVTKEQKDRIEGDHAFLETTYQKALKDQIDNFKDKIGVYDPK